MLSLMLTELVDAILNGESKLAILCELEFRWMLDGFKMPPKPREEIFTTEEVRDAVLECTAEESSDFEFGDLYEEEEELIDEGVDPELSVEPERYFSPLFLL